MATEVSVYFRVRGRSAGEVWRPEVGWPEVVPDFAVRALG